MSGLSLAVGAVLGCVVAPQNDLKLHLSDSVGDFQLLSRQRHAPPFSIVGNTTDFDVQGFPVIRKNSSGFQFSADEVKGSYSAQGGGTYQFNLLRGTGHTVMTYDSLRADQFLKVKRKESDNLTERSTLSSDQIEVDKKDDVVTARVKSPFHLSDDVEQGLWKSAVRQASTITGASGIFTFSAPEKPGVAKLLTGDVAGPVHYHSIQKSRQLRFTVLFGHTVRFLVPVEKVLDVVGDHLTADMSLPEYQIVLKGNVHVTSSAPDYSWQAEAEMLRVTVDEDWNIVGYDDGPSAPAAKPRAVASP